MITEAEGVQRPVVCKLERQESLCCRPSQSLEAQEPDTPTTGQFQPDSRRRSVSQLQRAGRGRAVSPPLCSTQVFSGLDEAHPHCEGVCFTEPTVAPASLRCCPIAETLCP